MRQFTKHEMALMASRQIGVLIAAGWTPSALIAAGWTPSVLIAAGWTPSDLRAAGWTPSDLRAAGCESCYAEDMMDNRYGRVRWGAGENRARTSAANWREPFKWDRAAAAAGKPTTVFCLSLGDIWDNEVDPLWRRQAFDVMERTPNLLYLLLSKRIGNAVKMCDPMAANPLLPRNCAIGATMVTQEEWDRDMPKLKESSTSPNKSSNLDHE